MDEALHGPGQNEERMVTPHSFQFEMKPHAPTCLYLETSNNSASMQ
jgi:hypothetical protein